MRLKGISHVWMEVVIIYHENVTEGRTAKMVQMKASVSIHIIIILVS